MNAVTYYRELVEEILSHVTEADMFLVQSVVTCGALFWLLHRAWLTLWKPVPELISILGVEVPDCPAVSLAGIKPDAITLHWTRPGPNRPVVKYLIQVNGVNVGESSRLETAITVTGLKPGHFYNVRVIAVGSNNFQAGSSIIRLRTYGRDGRPQLPNGRVPSNLSPEDQQNGALADSSDDSPAGRIQAAGIETAAVPGDPPAVNREPTALTNTGQRRNTGGRKHSPSNAAADQGTVAHRVAKRPEESMQQLTERFEAIRKETEELVGLVSKDAEDFKLQMSDLSNERDDKKQALKEKEEASEKLKREVHYSERANRQAQNRKTQKEKVLRDKQAERTKMLQALVRWKKEIEEMKNEQEFWEEEKLAMAASKDEKTEELRAVIRERQSSLNGLEEEIRIKGLQIKELEEERKNLPGAEDNEETRERDAAAAQRDIDWDVRERDLAGQLHNQAVLLRQLEAEFHGVQVQWNTLATRNPIMYHGNSSGVDFDPTGGQGKAKARRSRHRKSRTSTISSPVAGYPILDSPFPNASAYNNISTTNSSNFAPGPYFAMHHETAMVPLSEQMIGMSEADARALTAGAPLSPTATSLLPSNIFEGDDDPPSPHADPARPFGPTPRNINGPAHEVDPQSPGSSSRSASLMSSPQTSSHNLAMYGVTAGHDYILENDRRSLHSTGGEFGKGRSPEAPDQRTSHKGFSTIFTFPRARGKTMQLDGPALGSLKQGQSQSFPRSTEEPEIIINRPRRISFSSGWNVVPNLFNRSSTSGDATQGNGPAPARNGGARRHRGLNVLANSMDDPSVAFPDRDPSSPRPLSIASSDLPRPSTDSAPFGWPAVDGGLLNRNSPLATNWSINAPQTWSRNASRRPSIQHGSTTALSSGIATADDEFLLPEKLLGQSSPPPVGIIGTRPLSSHKPITPKLNPAAPTFTAMLSRTFKTDKGKSKEKTTEATITSDDHQSTTNISPSESRKSRDTPSIHTQNSVAESHESLDRTSSNTPSDMAGPSASSTKDKESSFRQLLRKGSSSKFSLSSIRGKDTGLFGGKKPQSTTANSDRNASVERDDSFDEYGEDVLGRSIDSVTSSPMIGSLASSEWKIKETQGGAPKEGRISWRFGLKGKDKTKVRESLDVDRSEAEMTGTEDEGMV